MASRWVCSLWRLRSPRAWCYESARPTKRSQTGIASDRRWQLALSRRRFGTGVRPACLQPRDDLGLLGEEISDAPQRQANVVQAIGVAETEIALAVLAKRRT